MTYNYVEISRTRLERKQYITCSRLICSGGGYGAVSIGVTQHEKVGRLIKYELETTWKEILTA
jgi:hypothetical protein